MNWNFYKAQHAKYCVPLKLVHSLCGKWSLFKIELTTLLQLARLKHVQIESALWNLRRHGAEQISDINAYIRTLLYNELIAMETRIKAATSNPSDNAFIRLIAQCELEAQKDFFRMFHMRLPDMVYGAQERI